MSVQNMVYATHKKPRRAKTTANSHRVFHGTKKPRTCCFFTRLFEEYEKHIGKDQ